MIFIPFFAILGSVESDRGRTVKKGTRFITQTAIVAAIYAALTLALAPISFGPMQVRVSEALCVLPFFMPAALPGLFLGCLISNAVGLAMGTALGPMDVIVGSLATLLAALVASKVKSKWLVPLPAVVFNAFLVAWTLNVMLGIPYWINVLWVGVGQAIACYALGMPLWFILNRNRKVIFER